MNHDSAFHCCNPCTVEVVSSVKDCFHDVPMCRGRVGSLRVRATAKTSHGSHAPSFRWARKPQARPTRVPPEDGAAVSPVAPPVPRLLPTLLVGAGRGLPAAAAPSESPPRQRPHPTRRRQAAQPRAAQLRPPRAIADPVHAPAARPPRPRAQQSAPLRALCRWPVAGGVFTPSLQRPARARWVRPCEPSTEGWGLTSVEFTRS